MAYSELVKDFNKIREYMREFYVYGFKSREEFTQKSARAYDDERRRIESWLQDYMSFKMDNEGKRIFISIDSRVSKHNPLYRAWKTKSFTDKEITLHFILFDILNSVEERFTLKEILNRIYEYTSEFEKPLNFDESTVRKKLNEYAAEGLVTIEKEGKTSFYKKSGDSPDLDVNVLDFFSEVAPCGVVGSYILDKVSVTRPHEEIMSFKHHYITSAMDSEVLYNILLALSDNKSITIESINRNKEIIVKKNTIPLKIFISTQSGRQYLMAYVTSSKRVHAFRLDNIISVEAEDVVPDIDKYKDILTHMMPHIWGVSTDATPGNRYEHVEFTVSYGKKEAYIPQRLMREKRCGTVTDLGNGRCRFEADVFDSNELLPWIRTFICRITDISFSNKNVEARFLSDLKKMYAMYGLEETSDVQ